MKSNAEKIASLEARKKTYEEKIQTYKDLIAECSQKIDTLKSQEIKNLLQESNIPFDELVQLLSSHKNP